MTFERKMAEYNRLAAAASNTLYEGRGYFSARAKLQSFIEDNFDGTEYWENYETGELTDSWLVAEEWAEDGDQVFTHKLVVP